MQENLRLIPLPPPPPPPPPPPLPIYKKYNSKYMSAELLMQIRLVNTNFKCTTCFYFFLCLSDNWYQARHLRESSSVLPGGLSSSVSMATSKMADWQNLRNPDVRNLKPGSAWFFLCHFFIYKAKPVHQTLRLP